VACPLASIGVSLRVSTGVNWRVYQGVCVVRMKRVNRRVCVLAIVTLQLPNVRNLRSGDYYD